MVNPLFDGEGIEFHHLQRARLAGQQAETNRLLGEQNVLLRRAEQAREQDREQAREQERAKAKAERERKEREEAAPKCVYCSHPLYVKEDHCPNCSRLLWWSLVLKKKNLAKTKSSVQAAQKDSVWVLTPPKCPRCREFIEAQVPSCDKCGLGLAWGKRSVSPGSPPK